MHIFEIAKFRAAPSDNISMAKMHIGNEPDSRSIDNIDGISKSYYPVTYESPVKKILDFLKKMRHVISLKQYSIIVH